LHVTTALVYGVACNAADLRAATQLGVPDMTQRSSTSARVQKHRDALRAAGLRPIQIWVPDTRRPGFADECRRQSLSVRGDPLERETLDWIAQVADHDGWR